MDVQEISDSNFEDEHHEMHKAKSEEPEDEL
jgi:hypothetical protein